MALSWDNSPSVVSKALEAGFRACLPNTTAPIEILRQAAILAHEKQRLDAGSNAAVVKEPAAVEAGFATYSVCCYYCNERFDALKSAWCSCLVQQRSLICPKCQKCFCQAEILYKQRFWLDAPQALWRFKLDRRASVVEKGNPSPVEIKRPLVMVVDDDREIRVVAERVIAAMNFGVVVAQDGAAAYELAQLYRPDLVLTDALMPRLDGRELCRKIKDDPSLAGMKVIVMSSIYRAAKFKTETITDFKADAYVAKPLDVVKLYELLRSHLGFTSPSLASSNAVANA